MEIGARLKEARVAKDISLDSLQETTKIQKRYLIAIEEGNFKILPGKFYARAFIKEYAAAVGLDPNELLEEYKEEIPQTEQDSTEQYTRIQRSRKESNPAKSSAIFSIIPTIIVVLLVIGIIFAAWFFIQKTASDDNAEPVEQPEDNEIIYSPEEENQTEDDTTSDGTSDGTETEDETDGNQSDDSTEDTETETPDPELTVVEQGTGTSPESTLALENAGEEVVLTLESEGKTWLEIENSDGESLFSGEFNDEKSPLELDVSDEERLYFNIGNAPSLTITINGVEMEYPVNPEEEVHQYIWLNLTQEQTN